MLGFHRIPQQVLRNKRAEQTTLALVSYNLGEPYIQEKKRTHRRVIFLNRHTVKTRSSYRNGIEWDFRLSTKVLK